MAKDGVGGILSGNTQKFKKWQIDVRLHVTNCNSNVYLLVLVKSLRR